MIIITDRQNVSIILLSDYNKRLDLVHRHTYFFHWVLGNLENGQKKISIYAGGPRFLSAISNTDGPRYMREIGTPKIRSNLMNSHIKRPRMTVN